MTVSSVVLNKKRSNKFPAMPRYAAEEQGKQQQQQQQQHQEQEFHPDIPSSSSSGKI